MTCRLPRSPLQSTSKEAALEAIAGNAAKDVLALGTDSDRFVPFTLALAGTLQLSHLHVGNEMNVLVHTARPKNGGSKTRGLVDSAAAYSVSAATRNTRVIIGDDLTFVFRVGWYDGTALPGARGASGSGGGGGGGTFFACLVSAAVGAGLCYLWLRGMDVPKSMRAGLGVDHIGMRRETGLPKYNGYGYGVGTAPQENGYGFTGSGKRD
jgi:hypothetical protein